MKRVALLGLRLGLGLGLVTGCGSQGALSQEVVDRARASGVAPDLIYAVELDGYRLLEQSAGGIGEEGYGAYYGADGGSGEPVQLRIDRGGFSDARGHERGVVGFGVRQRDPHGGTPLTGSGRGGT
ncbi:hypothetical protein, partial [Nonomuraea sp. NPDC005501]|uniref:hypothetical protein n=1 Tax=Nonomuraea sp. NPDC005501 TaxID=3156884 RepID=UPI0033AEA262